MTIPVKELMAGLRTGPPGPPYQDYVTKIAVIINPDTNTSEVIKVDRVRISAIFMGEFDRAFQTNFVLGGLDSTGKFHVSVGQGPALLAISYLQNMDWWNANMTGRTVFDYNEILRWIHDAGAVDRAGKDIWGIPNLISYYVGEPLPPAPPKGPPPSEKIPGVIPKPPGPPPQTGWPPGGPPTE